MARVQLTDNISIDFGWDNPEWRRIRTSPEMQKHLREIGETTATRCNTELRAAQARRKQPQEDGYTAEVAAGEDRSRLFVTAYTARAMAHEAVNNAILKNLPIGDKPQSPEANRSIPRELGELSAEARQKRRVFMSHVQAFT